MYANDNDNLIKIYSSDYRVEFTHHMRYLSDRIEMVDLKKSLDKHKPSYLAFMRDDEEFLLYSV